MTPSYLNTILGDISYTKDADVLAQKKNKEKKAKYYERNKEHILTKKKTLHLAKRKKRESLKKFFEQVPETFIFPHKGNIKLNNKQYTLKYEIVRNPMKENLQLYLIERLIYGYQINDAIYDALIDYFVSKISDIKPTANIKKILENEIGVYDNITSSLYLDISAEYFRRKHIHTTIEDLFSII